MRLRVGGQILMMIYTTKTWKDLFTHSYGPKDTKKNLVKNFLNNTLFHCGIIVTVIVN